MHMKDADDVVVVASRVRMRRGVALEVSRGH
jgi:hypothetical protein